LRAGIGPLATLGIALALTGCGAWRNADWVRIEEAGTGFVGHRVVRHPTLATDGGARVALTFVSPREDGSLDAWIALSSDSGASFGAPVRLNRRDGAVVSQPQTSPVASFGPGGRVAVAWIERREGATSAMDVMAAASGDGGTTFARPAAVNDDVADAKETLHGYPSIAFRPDGRLFASWIDERESRSRNPAPATSCVFAALSEDGGMSWGDNRVLTDRACPCCRPALAVDAGGRTVLAYRSGAANLRDPALLLTPDDGSSVAFDTLLAADRWELDSCPTSGPAVTAGEDGGVVAWYTGSGTPGVYLVPWRASIGPAGVRRTVMDSLATATEPRLSRNGDATWIAVDAAASAEPRFRRLAVRVLDRDGTLTPWSFLGADAGSGSIAAVSPDRALAAWIERGSLRLVSLKRIR
jgi:hypothetical protein